MDEAIIKKLELEKKDWHNGESFVNGLSYYKYKNFICINGKLDGTPHKYNMVTFFNKETNKKLSLAVSLLIDCEIEFIDKILYIHTR